MNDRAWLSRTELLLGKDELQRLEHAHLLVVGLGGVGSFAAEFVCRAGVGRMTIVDGDAVEPSNRNRQLPALVSTQGLPKAEVMARRLLDINPGLQLTAIQEFINPERVGEILDWHEYDYVIDAIDIITPKVTFLQQALARAYPLVSSMGAGGKLDPTQIRVVDIAKTYNCPFAQNVRKRLREINIRRGIRAVFSPELPPASALLLADKITVNRSVYGTVSYLPAAFGGVCASVAIRGLIGRGCIHD